MIVPTDHICSSQDFPRGNSNPHGMPTLKRSQQWFSIATKDLKLNRRGHQRNDDAPNIHVPSCDGLHGHVSVQFAHPVCRLEKYSRQRLKRTLRLTVRRHNLELPIVLPPSGPTSVLSKKSPCASAESAQIGVRVLTSCNQTRAPAIRNAARVYHCAANSARGACTPGMCGGNRRE